MEKFGFNDLNGLNDLNNLEDVFDDVDDDMDDYENGFGEVPKDDDEDGDAVIIEVLDDQDDF